MTRFRSIGVAAVLALQLAQSGCASAPARDDSPFYVAPRQDVSTPSATVPELGRHGGGRMQDGSGSDPTIPGGTGPHAGGSMSVGGGS